MSAAAARRRKQLAARQKASTEKKDVVTEQLDKILADYQDKDDMPEDIAYEALQLAQSAVRKRIKECQFTEACELAYNSSLMLLKKRRISVASQLLQLLADVLRETHTEETDEWINRLVELHTTHQTSMEGQSGLEANRLQRLERSWLLLVIRWSSELGSVKYGHNKLQELLGEQCWKVSNLHEEDQDDILELQCDAIQHMALAEQPMKIIEWLKALPGPTEEETEQGHECPPCMRDMLLTRAVLLMCAVENLRDANELIRAYTKEVEQRDVEELAKSYTSKDDGKAPSHVIFCNMLVRILEKDSRTGPLYQWLLRSFKRELDRFYKPQAVLSYHTKIGKIYFGIEPPPSMMKMMENMMSMMGGGGGPGGAGGINPAMMQAALAQMQGGV